MTWWQSLPAVATAISLLFIPGLLFGAALGVRGLGLAFMAPLASAGLVGAAGILGGLFGLRWSLGLLLGVTFATASAAFGFHWLWRRRFGAHECPPKTRLREWAPFAAALIAPIFLIALWTLRSIPSPESFVQAYDNVFHLNAIEYIVQTGNASSLTLGQMIQPGSTWSIYPSVWHSFAALIVEVCHVNVFVAENVLTLAVGAVLWPFASVALVRLVLGNKIIVLLATGILSSSFWVFPFQTIQRGPLFPNLLSYCLLPLVIVAMAGLFGLLRAKLANRFTLTSMLLVGIFALFTTQPNGFTALMVFFIPMFLGSVSGYALRLWKHGRLKAAIIHPMFIVIFVSAIFSLVWSALLLPYNKWQPAMSVQEAVFNVLTGALTNNSLNWTASLLSLVGVLVIVSRRRGYWIIGAFFLSGVLYVVAAAAPSGPFRNILVGSWYEDIPRLAALVPIFMLLLASVGVQGIAAGLSRSFEMLPSIRNFERTGFAQVTNISVPTVASCLVLACTTYFVADSTTTRLPTSVTPPITSVQGITGKTWVTANEMALMARIPSIVPEDEVIAVNPYNGSALAYAVSGRQLTQYQLTSGPSKELALIARNLSTAEPGSATCQAASAANIRYILDFGTNYLGDYAAARMYPGLVNVSPSANVQLVDQQGSAKLFEIVDC